MTLEKEANKRKMKVFWLVAQPGLWHHLHETKKEAIEMVRFYAVKRDRHVKLLRLEGREVTPKKKKGSK